MKRDKLQKRLTKRMAKETYMKNLEKNLTTKWHDSTTKLGAVAALTDAIAAAELEAKQVAFQKLGDDAYQRALKVL